jgi:hypothetical protein
MKLFLTATSERGKPITKSGNDWLKIEVIDENRQTIFTKTLRPKPFTGWVCASGHKQDEDGRCPCCNNDAY